MGRLVPRIATDRWLVCLDLEGRPELVSPIVLAGCRRALAMARSMDWRVVHLYRGSRERPGGLRALPGLSPLPSETVLFRPGLSAFSSFAFRDQLASLPVTELVVASSNMTTSGLATALTASDLGMEAVLVRDAFPDIEALEAVKALLHDHTRLSIAQVGTLAQRGNEFMLMAANQP